LDQKSSQITSEARRQIEGLLTAEQLTTLKDIIFSSSAIASLMDARFREELQLNDQQKAALDRFGRETSEVGRRVPREIFTKGFALLTPEQQQKLREEVDRRGL
jgi:hypothetical protein